MITRPVLPREHQQTFTRLALMEGAVEGLVTHGMGVTISDLVKHARRARKTLYDRYPDGRDELLRETLRWLAGGLFDSYTEGGSEAVQVWVRLNPKGVTVLLRYGHIIDPEYMLELSELAAENLQLPLAVVGGALGVLQRVDREGDDVLAALPELEAFVNLY